MLNGSRNFVISTLGNSDKDSILDHLKRLSMNDRFMRFFAAVNNSVLEKYVSSIDFYGQACFGIYQRNKKLIAFAHLGKIENDGGSKKAELGISVDSEFRNLGIASQLMKRIIVHGKSTGISTLYMSCLRQNESMQSIARKAGLRVVLDHEEALAELKLIETPLEKAISIQSEIAYKQMAIVDKCYRLNSEIIDILFRK